MGMLVLTASAWAENGVYPDRIVLGQSCALKGMASSLGQGMATGLQVYFDHVNSQGGINGRRIELISKNDGYEPMAAVRTTVELLDKDKVFMLIGEVGTPTSKAVLPVVDKNQVPFFAPFTGAELLRTPYNKWVINVRGSYNQEMEKLAQYLVGTRGMQRIACFYQDDAYGKAGLSGIQLALSKRGMELVGTGAYKRNTLGVLKGIADLRPTSPEAIVMVGAYTPCAAFIKGAKEIPELAGVTFCNISFVGTKALKDALGGSHDRCLVSQVVPYPWDESLPLVKEYNEVMSSSGKGAQVGFITLEGFMAAKLFCQVLEAMEGEPTREKFIDTLHQVGTFDLGGIKLAYGPGDHQGMDEVFIVEFLDSGFQLVTE
jgi:ABC-type branched-subunit amino acid transport system substrate-binding protein